MDNMKINGENWLIETVQKCGDMTIITGIANDGADIVKVNGHNMTVELYKALIEAFTIYNTRGHLLKLYLDIPYIVRDELKRWVDEHDLSEDILFSDSLKTGEYTSDVSGFAETFTTSPGLERCFVILSQSRIIPGNITGILTYLEERFGE